MSKVSKYRQRLLRERAYAGCEMLQFILDKWRKAYPVYVGGNDPASLSRSWKIYETLLADADKMASEWDREYKEAIGLLAPKDST